MDGGVGSTGPNDDVEIVANLEREIAQAEEQIAGLQRRIRVAEVEARAATRPNQFDATGVSPVLTALAKRPPEQDFELTMVTGFMIGLVGGGFFWLFLSLFLKR